MWEDWVLTISNIAILIALMPLFLAIVFKTKTIELGLAVTGSVTGFFLLLIGAATISLGAVIGGTMAMLNALLWIVIAGVSFFRK